MMKKFLLLFLMLPFLAFGQLSGPYLINTASTDAHFKTLAAAVAHINEVGVKNPVTFLIDEDQTVTSPIEIKQFTGSNKINTLTIKPNFGKSIVIKANMPNNFTGIAAVFMFNAAKNVIIDGSNDDSLTKNLTLINNGILDEVSRAVIWVASDGVNKCTALTVKNTKLQFTKRTAPARILSAVYSGSNSMDKNKNLNVQPSTAANSNILVENNEMINVKDGININGSSEPTESPAGWIIKGNKIGSSINVEKPIRGIFLSNVLEYTISDNIIDGVLNTENQGNDTAGILLLGTSSGKIARNYIINIGNSIYNNGYSTSGILINSSGVTNINNNIITNVFVDTADSNDYNYHNKAHGILVSKGSTINIIYNTIMMKGAPSSTAYSSCVYVMGGLGITIKNNIFINSQSNKQYAIFKNGGTFASITNNNYYITNAKDKFANRIKNEEYIGATGFTSWNKSVSDNKSVSILPKFVSDKDLHLQNDGANDTLQGIFIPEITSDVDGDIRTKPYMGADEIVCKLPVPTILTTEPTCEAAGTAKITNYSSANTYEFLPIGLSVGTDGIISGLIAGVSYKVTAKNGNCVSVASLSFFVTSQTTVFNGSWSTPPTPNLSAIIQSQYSSKINGKLNVCSLTITNNSAVAINKKNSFTVQNNVIVDMGSSLTIESDANLIQINNASPANSGNITVLRDIKIGAGRTQYNYLGSPVTFASGQNLKTIYPGITFALYHVESNNFFGNSSGANIPGRGLAIKEPTTTGVAAGTTVVTAQYKGVPQNGEIRFALANSNTDTNSSFGYNLLGNPYPSNIDLTKLYDLNGGDHAKGKVSKNIDATFYLWDNEVNNDIALAQQGSAYKGQAYAVYNVLAGSKGTGTSAAGFLNNNIIGAKKPEQVLKVGQGFMTKAIAKNYTLIFNNSIRTEAEVTSSFLGRAQSQDAEDDRFWLKLISPANLTSTMAVVYYEGGSNTVGAEDSESKLGSDDIFSLVDDQKVAVNGKSSFVDTDRISLGTQHFQAGIYTIGLEAKEGVFAQEQPIYLKDKQTGSVTKLTEGTYSFEVEAGETADRFEIIYQPETVLVTDTKTKESVVVYRDADQFIIKAPKRMATVFVYDLSGKMIKVLKPHQKEVALDANQLSSGVYVLNITTEDGEVFNRKISK